MSVQSLFARISSLVIDHSLKNMDKRSGKRQARFSLSPQKTTRLRGRSRQNQLPQSELLETRTLLAAPQIGNNGGNPYTILGNSAAGGRFFEDAWRNPVQSPTDYGTNTPPPNSTLQYADGNPLYLGVVLPHPVSGVDTLYPVPFTLLSASDSNGANGPIWWDVPNAGNPDPDGDNARAFAVISANTPGQGPGSPFDRVRPDGDDYAAWNGLAWELRTLPNNWGALIANDHFDYGGEGGGVSGYSYYQPYLENLRPANPFNDTDVLDSDGDGISEVGPFFADNFDVDGDIYTGTDSDNGGDFNFENQSSLTVTVRARSVPPTGAIQSDSIAITIQLHDVNDAPFIPVDFDDSINVFYISERLGQGEFVGDLVTWDEDNSPVEEQDNSLRDDPIQLYEIVQSPQVLNAAGALVDVFEISPNTGEISINNEIDVDLSEAEEILAAYFDYETLGDRRDAPAGLALLENPSDPFYIDNGYIYMDVWGFVEDSVQDDWFLPLTVRVTDFRNLSDPLWDNRVSLRSRDTVVYIGILDASEYAPIIPEDQLTLSINENTPSNDISNRTIGTITPDPQVTTFFIDTVANAGDIVTGNPTDPANYGDRDQFYTFAIDPATNPGGAFIVVPQVDPVSGLAKSAEIRVGNVNAIDFEQRSTFTISLIVTDVGLDPLSTRVTVTVNVDDLNEATTLPNTTFTLAENTAKDALVGTVNATDIDILTAVIDYQVIDGNQAIILIDAENKAKYEALLPSGGPLDPGDTITFQDIFTLDPVTGVVRVSQNINDDYIINGTLFDTEDLSGVDPSFFLDFEVTPTFNLILRATDSGNPNPGFSSDDATITINLIDVIEGEPTVQDAAFIINENVPNGTLVGTVVGSPGDDSIFPILYSIVGGNTGNAFAINANNGQLTVNNMTQLDFETTPLFTLIIQVTDSSNPASFEFGTVTVTLNDVSEPVTIVGGQSFNVDENSPTGTVVGTVAFNEPDNGQTNTWEILGGNTGGTFAITTDPVTGMGVITVNTNDELDFETNPQFSLIVKVTDSGTPAFSDSSVVTINLNDIEPEPPIIDDQTVTLDEYSPAGTLVTTVVPNSLSPGQTATFAIIGGDPNGDFVIDAVTGEITVVNPLIDFDDTPTFALIVEATDNAPTPLSDTATVTVNLNNLDFSPVVVDQTFGLLDTTPNGDPVGTIAASDVDDEDTLNFTASNFSIAGIFSVDSATGVITLDDNTNLPAAPADVTFDITISDGNLGTPDVVAQITMAVRELNDPPVINDAMFDLIERSVPGTSVGTVGVTDPNAGQTHLFSITAGNGLGGFVIDPGTGEISVADDTVIDFSRIQVFTLTVEVVDNGTPALSDTAEITINVLEFNGPIQMSDQEQLLLELINRARLDPLAEAARLGLDQAQTDLFVSLGTDAVQALAANEFLVRASVDHSVDMLDRNFFGHVNPDGDSFDVRAFGAGYDFNSLAENIDMLTGFGLDQATIQLLHDRMILDPIKRLNLLDGAYREFGAGIRNDVGLNATVVTDLLAREDATGAFITGVVFTDAADGSANDDDFYSIGEAVRSGRVRATNRVTGEVFERVIGNSGAFSLRVPDGTYDVIAFGGDLGADTFAIGNVVVNGQNVKVDFEISSLNALTPSVGISGFEDGNWWVSTQVGGNWQTSLWGQFPVSTLKATVSGDFNGDGLDDVAGWALDGNWYLGLGQSNGSLAVSLWNGWVANDATEVLVGDFNGDGMDDLVARDSGGFWWVAESQGNTFTTQTWGKWNANSNWKDIKVADFNNDGRDDIIGRAQSGRLTVGLSNGTKFNSSKWGQWSKNVTWQDVSVGDFNGDGRADITGRANSGRWRMSLSQGNAFTTSNWSRWTVNGNWNDVVVGDFDGDGIDDIAGRRDSNKWWIAISQGSAFSKLQFWGKWDVAENWSDVVVADFNTDGRTDIAGRNDAGQWDNLISQGSNFLNELGSVWNPALNWTAVFAGSYIGVATFNSPPAAPPAFAAGGSSSAPAAGSQAGPTLVYEASDSSGEQTTNQKDTPEAGQTAPAATSADDSSDSLEELFGDSNLLDLLYQV